MPKAVALSAGAFQPVTAEAEPLLPSFTPAAPWELHPSPRFDPLLFHVGKSLPRMSKGPDCCLGVYLLFLSLQAGGLVTPIHLPRANVFDCLEFLEMTETSSPNKTTELMRRDESSQVPDGCGSGSSRLLKQPPCRRALKLQGSFFYLFV